MRSVASEPPEESRPTALKIVAAPETGDTPALYANHVQVSFTPEDFTLHLGWYTFPPFGEPPETEEVVVPVRPLLKVSLPLNLVRGIAAVLQAQIETYEKGFGHPVPDHPSPPAALVKEEASS
jgi:hypothetical protein